MSKKENLSEYDGVAYDFVGELVEDTRLVIEGVVKSISVGVCSIVPDFACNIVKKVKSTVTK